MINDPHVQRWQRRLAILVMICAAVLIASGTARLVETLIGGC